MNAPLSKYQQEKRDYPARIFLARNLLGSAHANLFFARTAVKSRDHWHATVCYEQAEVQRIKRNVRKHARRAVASAAAALALLGLAGEATS